MADVLTARPSSFCFNEVTLKIANALNINKEHGHNNINLDDLVMQ